MRDYPPVPTTDPLYRWFIMRITRKYREAHPEQFPPALRETTDNKPPDKIKPQSLLTAND